MATMRERLEEPSVAIHERGEAAWEMQRQRFARTKLTCNADMGSAEVREYCRIDNAGRSLLRAAMTQLSMSARAFHRILKQARTIADLAGSEEIEAPHLAEAIQYRPRRHMYIGTLLTIGLSSLHGLLFLEGERHHEPCMWPTVRSFSN